jgi:hypothetical protein
VSFLLGEAQHPAGHRDGDAVSSEVEDQRRGTYRLGGTSSWEHIAGEMRDCPAEEFAAVRLPGSGGIQKCCEQRCIASNWDRWWAERE